MDIKRNPNDEGTIIRDLVDYVSCNNQPSEIATTGSYTRNILDSNMVDMLSSTIKLSYGVNLRTISDYLYTQDAFFSKYMPHWLAYFDALGIKANCVMLKTSDLSVQGIISSFPKKERSLAQFNPFTKWTREDLEYGDQPDRNLINPLNIFYKVWVYIFYIDKYPDFCMAMGKLCDMDINIKEKIDNGTPITVGINLLPSPSTEFMEHMTDLIHKYL